MGVIGTGKHDTAETARTPSLSVLCVSAVPYQSEGEAAMDGF